MEFQRINRTNPERVFIVMKNSVGSARKVNEWVAHDVVTDEDGVSFEKPKGANRTAIAGVAIEAIADGDYGLIQVWGFRNAARMAGGSGLVTSKISEGTFLYVKTSGFAAAARANISVASTAVVAISAHELDKVGIAMSPTNTAAKATSATTWVGKCFIKCL